MLLGNFTVVVHWQSMETLLVAKVFTGIQVDLIDILIL